MALVRMMAIHEAKENFGNRRCRSDRSWRSFPEGRFSFSNVRIRDLSVLKEDLTGNRVDCQTSIGRSGNGSKPGENAGGTPVTTAKPKTGERARGRYVAKPTPQMLQRPVAQYRAQYPPSDARQGKWPIGHRRIRFGRRQRNSSLHA